MERVAMYLQDKHEIREGMEYAKYAEARGFEAVWQAESRLVRDAIVPMAAYAAVTSKLKVGSGVINNWTRNIGLLAATFLTLDDLAPNRIICGIGAWWDPLAKNVGIERKKPLKAMRETISDFRGMGLLWDRPSMTNQEFYAALKNSQDANNLWALKRFMEYAPSKVVASVLSLEELSRAVQQVPLRTPYKEAWDRAVQYWSENP